MRYSQRHSSLLRLLRPRLLHGARLDPGDPEFLRVTAIHGAIVMLGGSGLAFALFNLAAFGAMEAATLIAFDLGTFFIAVLMGIYLRRSGDIRGSAMAMSATAFVALLVLAWSRSGGEHFLLWTMQRRLQGIHEDLEQISMRDGLTGVYNRRYFNQLLPAELARAEREGRRLLLVLFDVDHFKAFNDQFGHPAGDQALIAIARAVPRQAWWRDSRLFRVGGEEFAVLGRAATTDDAAAYAESIRAAVEDLGIPAADSAGPNVTVSVGFLLVEPHATVTAEAAYSLADRALYAAKRDGRNRTMAAAHPGSSDTE